MAKVKEQAPASTPFLPLAKSATGYAILARPADEVREIMASNMGGGGVTAGDLDRIKVPSSGNQFWTLNTLDGEIPVRDFEAIILHWQDTRAYWERGLDQGGGQPPDCSSQDCVHGVGNPGGVCQSCPLAQWGSDPKGGRGQACKMKRLLFVLRPENMLPDVLFVPPTSLKPLRQYFMRLASQATPYWSVRTRFTLAGAKNGGGIDYSTINASLAGRLEGEDLSRVKAVMMAFRPSIDRVQVKPSDYQEVGASAAP
jgi:hypothetical protein